MRELKIGETTIRVKATPLALLFYKQEFKTDLLGDLIKMADVQKDMSKFDTVSMLQLVWAMAKADAYGKQFPSFVEWISQLETIDLSDKDFLVAALEEATDGFLRNRGKGEIRKQK